MPHQCTSCERVFPNGSQQMLSGCPECEGNTFQYIPEDAAPDSIPREDPPERPGVDSSMAERVGRAATKLRDVVSTPESDSMTTTLKDFANSSGGESGQPSTDTGTTATTGGASGSAADPEPSAPTEPAEATGESATPAGEQATLSAATQDSTDEAASGTAADDGTAATDDDEMADEEGARTRDVPVEGSPADGYDAVVIDDGPGEDFAQSSARSDLVTTDELPDNLGGFSQNDAKGNKPAPKRTDDDIIIGDDHERQPVEHSAESTVAADDSTATEPAGSQPPADPTVGARSASRASDSASHASETQSTDAAAYDRPDLSELREELNDQFESIKIVEPGQYELNLMELYEREETIIALKENGRYVIDVPDTWHGDDAE